MAHGRKYAALLDLDDQAPDIYETPDLTDDTSTQHTSVADRSASPTSSYNSDDETSRISRGRRSSYRTSSQRRRRHGAAGDEEFGDFSDEEDESLERKLARLRREVEEVKAEFARRKKEEKHTESEDLEVQDDGGIADLGSVLGNLHLSRQGSGTGAGSCLAQQLQRNLRARSSRTPAENASTQSDKQDDRHQRYTVSYTPQYQESHALAKAADFDSRLTLLEKALGINALAIPELGAGLASTAILPKLATLDQQLSTLSTSSASSLDSASRKVRQLTKDAERLDELRRSARVASKDTAATAASARTAGTAPPHDADVASATDADPEHIAKINALYGTLSTIESLSPLLPSVIDRLRALRALHASAATASETLDAVEKRQDDMATEIGRWSEGLQKVETTMKRGEEAMAGNLSTVEGWVRDLETRMKRFAGSG
ncbi:hypothetical protein B0A49_12312 [Cryomyces minteri]|uniref:Dynactin subunit 2 n=2 Tax=Cryomyces minteri TaxID=331657 RepID=A0A4U0V4R9_9PEZI|nr:hypothetical protein B0A49_12312 [Cryomyces minteri]